MNFENKIVTIKPVDSNESFMIRISTKCTSKYEAEVLQLKFRSLYNSSRYKLLYESLILAQDERWRRA